MTRYYFDVTDGDGLFVDDVGMELPNIESAVREARKAMADMARDVLREDGGQEVTIGIREGADGPVVTSVTLKTDVSP